MGFNKFYEPFVADYFKTLELTGFANSGLNYFSYCLSRCPDFNISPFAIIFGVERIGKTTLSDDIFFRYYLDREIKTYLSMDETLTKSQILELIDIRTSEQLPYQSISFLSDYQHYTQVQKEMFLNDEGIITSDRREAMKKANVAQLKTLNVFAQNLNPLLSLTQYLSDLDTRLVKRANFLVLIYKKGRALVFMPQKNISFINYISTIEEIKKNPEIVSDPDAITKLRKFKDYVLDIKYKTLPEGSRLETVSQKIKKELMVKMSKTF